MKDLAFKAWCKAQYAKQRAKDMFTSDEGGADTIIIAIIIIVVVLGLAVVFRNQIWRWFNNLTSDASSLADTDFGTSSTSSPT